MGCEFSRMLVWWSKPGRKRLSSGDSDFRHDADSQDYDERADNTGDGDKLRVLTKTTRLRNMFSRKRSKEKKACLPGKSTTNFPTSRLHVEIDADAETAVRNRNAEQVLKLLQQGGGFDLVTGIGLPKKVSPVELACSLGYFDIVEVFLDNGCSPNLPTTAGKLLHSVLESIKSHEDSLEMGQKLVKRLICLGCDLDIKDRAGITPLMHCAQIGDSQLVQMVLDRCSDRQLTCQCAGSFTPLQMSAMKGDFQCVKLLLSRSPHKHVNETDKSFNTALHLALKSMRHNIPYLNAAKENLVSGTKEQSKERTSACQHLMIFQQNSVAIVEALVMAGANVHAPSCHFSFRNRNKEDYLPLVYALQLCALDNTLGFELDPLQFSSTLNLVSRQTIQSLEDLGKAKSEHSEVKSPFSPYAGVVRLLVLAGTELSTEMRTNLYTMFPSLQPLLDEICAFWDKYQVSKPPKLVHMSKLVIRAHLADVHKLHEINKLPLPPRMKEYLKLNYL